jgi:pyruvate dehydrogenase E2 component (dihydrolipoamide acetyltransferase)
VDILMPQLGETVAEGKVTKWFKAAGDAVKPGDNLFEIETDKVSMEVPATEAGILAEIRVSEGEIVPVGAVVAVIAAEGSPVKATPAAAVAKPAAPAPAKPAPAKPAAAAAAPVAASPAPAQPRAPVEHDPFHAVRTPERNFGRAKLPGGTHVTPLARRLAVENGIDLGALSPSGPHGRLVARDVETALAKLGRTPVSAVASSSAVRDATAKDAAQPAPALARGPAADRVKALYEPGSYEEVPLDGMRRTIASRLMEAKQTIPHFYLTGDVTLERVMTVRAEMNATAGEDTPKLSINDFVIKALALALQRVPAANAVWADDRILRFKTSDIGIAVAIEGGLITPVIRGAETKTLSQISAEMRELAGRARAKKLKPQEYQGGASAISNLGMYGVREFAAIINPPHATILAVGAGERRPVETPEGIRFASQMSVTLSCDHRVVDGTLGAELLAAFKLFFEHPVGMMI